MTGTLKDFSDQLADLVDSAASSVVTVSARRGKPASGTAWENGVVVTSSHAVVDEDQILVTDAAGEHRATLAGRDGASDLAVLRLEGLAATPAVRGGASRPGNVVLALGRPGELRASVGHVVSISSRQHGWRGGLEGMVLSDAHLYEGFSGGPLVDSEGKLVGLNSWFYGRGTTLTLPAETAEAMIKSLLAHGRVKQPFLGIGSQPVILDPASAGQAGQDRGLMIIGVEADSPASRAGVLQGDTLVGLDSNAVGGMRQLFRALRAVEVDTEHTLRIVRAGKVIEVKVTIGEREEDPQG